MKNLISLTLLLLSAFFPIAINATPKVGDMAPSIKLTVLLRVSGKVEENIKSLKGKVVVLEFWATWCAPCIGAMPHLNELSRKYKDKGVQFISITDETAEKVELFLKRRSINGWVGLDGNEAMSKAYDVNFLPFTVVIGANGIILGYPDSKTLSEEMLDKALAGQILSQPMVSAQAAPSTPIGANLTKPIYELSIRPSGKGISSRIGPDSYKASGASALNIIGIAFDAALKYTELSTALPEGRFDVVATNFTKSSPDWSWRTQLKQLVQDVWEIHVQQEKKVMDVYELIASPATLKRLKKADSGEVISKQGSDEGILIGRNTSMDVLCKALQDRLGQPVLNATNLSGNYDYNLYFDNSKPETLLKAVEEETGLTLRRVKRSMDVLMIVPKK